MVVNKNKDIEFRGIASVPNQLRVTSSQLAFNPRGKEAQKTLNDMRQTFKGINQSLDKTYHSSFQYLAKEKTTLE